MMRRSAQALKHVVIMALFTEDFSPLRGDLVYGIIPGRNAYISAWRSKIETDYQGVKNQQDELSQLKSEILMAELEAIAKNWHTCDSYNNHYGVPSMGQVPKNQVGAHMQTQRDKLPQGSDRQEAYHDKLMGSRFSPVAVHDATPNKLAQEGYGKSNFNSLRNWFKAKLGIDEDKSRIKRATEQNKNYLAIRRACKFGIGMVAEDGEFTSRGAKIHFVLDGLEMAEVVNKGTRKSKTGTEKGEKDYVSITVSELRYVFRNWGRLNGKVELYVNLQPVAAPWLSDWGTLQCIGMPGAATQITAETAGWQKYYQERLQKYNVTSFDQINKTLT
jgi:hypothetical protein